MTFEPPKLRKHHLRTNPADDMTVTFVTDGTHTVVEVIMNDQYSGTQVVGCGESKRRKGERRNRKLGVMLAMERALRNAADNYAASIKEITGGGIK